MEAEQRQLATQFVFQQHQLRQRSQPYVSCRLGGEETHRCARDMCQDQLVRLTGDTTGTTYYLCPRSMNLHACGLKHCAYKHGTTEGIVCTLTGSVLGGLVVHDTGYVEGVGVRRAYDGSQDDGSPHTDNSAEGDRAPHTPRKPRKRRRVHMRTSTHSRGRHSASRAVNRRSIGGAGIPTRHSLRATQRRDGGVSIGSAKGLCPNATTYGDFLITASRWVTCLLFGHISRAVFSKDVKNRNRKAMQHVRANLCRQKREAGTGRPATINVMSLVSTYFSTLFHDLRLFIPTDTFREVAPTLSHECVHAWSVLLSRPTTTCLRAICFDEFCIEFLYLWRDGIRVVASSPTPAPSVDAPAFARAPTAAPFLYTPHDVLRTYLPSATAVKAQIRTEYHRVFTARRRMVLNAFQGFTRTDMGLE